MPEWIDSPDGLDLLGIAGALAATAVIVMAIRAAARGIASLYALAARVRRFLDDIYGDPGDDNHEATPGVIHRMGGMEAVLHEHIAAEDDVLAGMRSEMTALAQRLEERTQPLVSGYENDGNSLTDISKRVTSIGLEVADLRVSNDAKHEALGAKIDAVSSRVDGTTDRKD